MNFGQSDDLRWLELRETTEDEKSQRKVEPASPSLKTASRRPTTCSLNPLCNTTSQFTSRLALKSVVCAAQIHSHCLPDLLTALLYLDTA